MSRRDFPRATVACTFAVLALAMTSQGCRSFRYQVGDALSPDWMKSSATKERYALYTNNAQNYYDLAGQAMLEGDAQKARRNYYQAEAQFKHALDYDSYSFKAHLGAGYAMLAQETYEKVEESIEFLEVADDLRPGEWRVSHGLARAHQILARMDGEEMDRLTARRERASEGDRVALDAKVAALKAGRMRHLQNSLDRTHQLMRDAPDQHQGYVLLGTTYALLHQYDRAIQNLETYIEKARTSRVAWRKMRRAGVLPEGVTGSMDQVDQKIRRNLVKDAEAKDLLATIYKNRGEYKKAIAMIDSIYEVNPAALPKFLPARAQMKAKVGDYDGAVEDLNVFIRKLSNAGYGYDDLVKRAMFMRTEYAEQATKAKIAASNTAP